MVALAQVPATIVAALLVVLANPLGAAEKSPSSAEAGRVVGKKVESFALRDFRGKTWSLDDFKDRQVLVVAFLGTECPLVKLYSSRLVELERKYGGRGVGIVGVNANQHDSITEIAHHARVHKIDFPVLKDVGNVVADRLGAQRTPEVFVLDERRVVRYWGRIDDQYTYGVQRPKVERNYLIEAIDALLAGEKIATPQTESVGCHIGRILQPKKDSDVTYSNQISRILQRRCVSCHRPGEIAPFALTDYKEVVGWAEMIDEVVGEQRMPPWHANPKFGHFANDTRLTGAEQKLIHRWVAAGAPRGDPKQLPPPRKFTAGWRIGPPDQVIYIRDKPFDVPATGEVKYQYFVVDPGFKEDKWIKAAECRAGNRAVVHHIIVAVMGQRRVSAHGLGSDWITAMAPGSSPLVLDEGLAKFVPAGSKLVFQLHYTPNGTPQQDRSSVGFIFADPKKVRQVVGTQKAVNGRFVIPPGKADHRVEASYRFQQDGLMLALFPHMHLRGKSFRYTAVYPDGKREVLLDVPRYDFNWQTGYKLAQPKRIPAGTRLDCVAVFDNSADNLANPDPTATVRWGDQTWEEMMIGYFDMALADQDLTKQPAQTRRQQFEESAALGAARIDEPLKKLAAGALESDEALLRLARELRRAVPQLDRVCMTTVDGGLLKVIRVAQQSDLRRIAGGSGIELPAAKMGLAKFVDADDTTVVPDLSQRREPDLRLMSRGVSSSVHVRITHHGKPATLNFWSAEPDAFPQTAVKLLEQVAEMLTAK